MILEYDDAFVMSLETGTRLDQYEILAAIGSGAMGDVYKANDTRLDRVVAVKVITATRDLDPQARDRFDREARALAALSHPHICNVYHYGDYGGTPFLVMEYLEGQTVAQRLRLQGRLPPQEVLRHAAEIADALTAAHDAGIVHRDLKPENVMLTARGAKLLDLGVSKRVPAEDYPYRGTTQLALTLAEKPIAATPTGPVETEEAHAKTEIARLVSQDCAAYATLQAPAVQRLFPTVDMTVLQTQFAQYTSLECTVTSPPEFERFGVNEAGAGGAQIRFGMKQVMAMKIGGAPATSETIVTLVLSRRDRTSPWLIDRVSAALKPK